MPTYRIAERARVIATVMIQLLSDKDEGLAVRMAVVEILLTVQRSAGPGLHLTYVIVE